MAHNLAGGATTQPDEITITEIVTQPEMSGTDELVLHLRAENAPPRVQWATDTVDNEHMGKKKSKCCCIYKKKKDWDDPNSDNEDDDCETGHCRGHVEKHKNNEQNPGPSENSNK